MTETRLLSLFLHAGVWTIEASLILCSAWLVGKCWVKNAAMRHLLWLISLGSILLLPVIASVVPPLLVVRTNAPAKIGEMIRNVKSFPT